MTILQNYVPNGSPVRAAMIPDPGDRQRYAAFASAMLGHGIATEVGVRAKRGVPGVYLKLAGTASGDQAGEGRTYTAGRYLVITGDGYVAEVNAETFVDRYQLDSGDAAEESTK